MTFCKHCGREIVWAKHVWEHRRTGYISCSPTASTDAEPR